MNQKLDQTILIIGVIIIIALAFLFPSLQLLIAILATIAFLYMALKYDALKAKTEKKEAKK
jgi:predicted membrane protein